MVPTAEEFAGLIKPKTVESSFALGSVDPAYSAGNPRILFDGETIVSAKTYSHLANYSPAANDRVILAKVSKSYLVLGKFS